MKDKFTLKDLDFIINTPYKTKEEEIIDMCIHSQKQNIAVDGMQMYQAFDELYKRRAGTCKKYIGTAEYYPRMLHRHKDNMYNCWDVIEMKAIYNQEFNNKS